MSDSRSSLRWLSAAFLLLLVIGFLANLWFRTRASTELVLSVRVNAENTKRLPLDARGTYEELRRRVHEKVSPFYRSAPGTALYPRFSIECVSTSDSSRTTFNGSPVGIRRIESGDYELVVGDAIGPWRSLESQPAHQGLIPSVVTQLLETIAVAATMTNEPDVIDIEEIPRPSRSFDDYPEVEVSDP